MGYRLAIFDMDGTILDTLEDLTNSLNAALSSEGFPSRTADEVRSFLGNGMRRLVERGVPEEASAAEIAGVFHAFNAHYAVHCADNTRAYTGITEGIVGLRRRGIKTAVVSNKSDYGVQALCSEYFEGLFDVVVGIREGIHRKPCPDSVNAVLKELGIAKEAAVYIGDSEVDIQTAKNAEMSCILVDWGFRSKEQLTAAGAETIVSDPRELFALITEKPGL